MAEPNRTPDDPNAEAAVDPPATTADSSDRIADPDATPLAGSSEARPVATAVSAERPEATPVGAGPDGEEAPTVARDDEAGTTVVPLTETGEGTGARNVSDAPAGPVETTETRVLPETPVAETTVLSQPPAPTEPVAVDQAPARPVAERAPVQPVPPPPPPPTATQPVLEPAESEVAAPRTASNRLAGTAWVLLAAGLFELLFLASLGLLVAVFTGPAAVVPQFGYIARTPLVWLPVLFFFLLFELTVLLFNRAGRFAYVVGSLVVAVLTYAVSVLLILLMTNGTLGDSPTLLRALIEPDFVLIGLVAREVMLWTGFAIGARGTRIRRRNREARDAYRQRLAERSDAAA